MDEASFPLTPALSLGALVSTQVRKGPNSLAFLPLLLTKDGGEGRGEEARFVSLPRIGGPVRGSGTG